MLRSLTQQDIDKKKFVIIGAGIAGATAAKTLKECGIPQENITILEKNNRIGGKLKTYTTTAGIHIDMGAVILSPIHPALDPIAEYHFKVDHIFPQNKDCMNQILYGQPLTFGQKTLFWCQYTYQAIKFLCLNSSSTMTYGELQQTTHLNLLTPMLKIFVPAMGYGALEDMTIAKLRHYVNASLLLGPLLKYDPGKILARVHEGYQQVPEKMLEEFNVKTSIKITHIKRTQAKTTIFFHDKHQDDSLQEIIETDYLILAISPFYWSSLGMELTHAEQACVDSLHYYRYPVAVCKIKNLPAEQIFISESLEKNGFNHIALIVPQSENLENWRYATVYVNLPPGSNNYSLENETDLKNFLHDLSNLGFDEVEILTHKIWKDYSSTPNLFWLKQLEAQQRHLNTFYLGGFMRFENVSNTMQHAQETLRKHFGKLPNCFENIKIYHHRTKTFFSLERGNTAAVNININVENETDRLLVQAPRLR